MQLRLVIHLFHHKNKHGDQPQKLVPTSDGIFGKRTTTDRISHTDLHDLRKKSNAYPHDLTLADITLLILFALNLN